MRLSDLLEGDENTYTGARVGYNNHGYKNYSSEEIADAIAEVMKSPEYDELTKIVPMISTPVKLKHGLLSFEIDKDTCWEINVQGNIRLRRPNAETWRGGRVETRGLLKAAMVNNDASLATRYIANIKEILIKLQKRSTAQAKSFSSEERIESLSDVDLSSVSNSIVLRNSALTDLVGCPSSLNLLFISNNRGLLSLKGCPERIGKKLVLADCGITDLEFLPKKIGEEFDLSGCSGITSLAGIGKKFILSCKTIRIWRTDITSNILGLLLVKNLQTLAYSTTSDGNFSLAMKTVEKHLKGDRDIMDCKEELIAAGLKDYAKL